MHQGSIHLIITGVNVAWPNTAWPFSSMALPVLPFGNCEAYDLYHSVSGSLIGHDWFKFESGQLTTKEIKFSKLEFSSFIIFEFEILLTVQRCWTICNNLIGSVCCTYFSTYNLLLKNILWDSSCICYMPLNRDLTL